MLVLLLDLYSLLNNKAISKEEIQAKLLKMIRHQLRKENLLTFSNRHPILGLIK